MLSATCSDALCAVVQQPWFFLLDLVGTFAFAVSGFMVAHRERMSFFGAFVLACFPAMAGGVVRDLMVQRSPIGFLSSPLYLATIVLVVAGGSALLAAGTAYHKRYPKHFQRLCALSQPLSKGVLEVFDALGLAAFSMIAVKVVVVAELTPLWAWGPFFAMVTGCGGGIVRDLFCSRKDHPLLTTVCYGEVAWLWTTFFAIFLEIQEIRNAPSDILVGVAITVIGIFVTRMLAYHHGIPAVSLYTPLFFKEKK